jgi:hypothetical protein
MEIDLGFKISSSVLFSFIWFLYLSRVRAPARTLIALVLPEKGKPTTINP